MKQYSMRINEALLSEEIQRAGFDIRDIPRQVHLITVYDKFIKIPEWVIDLTSKGIISARAFQLYAAISSYCYYNKSFTWVSKAQLAKKTGLSIRTVYRLLNELVEAGAIYIYTTKINNVDKSIIFLLSKRNIEGPQYVESKRHFFSNKKDTDTTDTTIMSEMTVGYCQNRPALTVRGVRRNTNNGKQREQRTNNSENNTRGARSRIATRKNIKSTNIRAVSDKTRLQKSIDFARKYYKAINRKFGTKLRSRASDIANIYSFFDAYEVTPQELWEFIKRHLNDEYFLKTNKHLSVWTGPKYTQLLERELKIEDIDLMYPDFLAYESVYDIEEMQNSFSWWR